MGHMWYKWQMTQVCRLGWSRISRVDLVVPLVHLCYRKFKRRVLPYGISIRLPGHNQS